MPKKAIRTTYYGERIACLRKSKNLTQEQFAEEIGMSPATISSIEQGRNQVSAEVAIAIADRFGVSLDWIYGRTEDTNDEASTMLLYLKKIMGFHIDQNYTHPYFFVIGKPFFDFFEGYVQATKLFNEGAIPEAAYNPWIDKLKDDFNKAMKENPDAKEYGLIPKSELFRKDTPTIKIDWSAPVGQGGGIGNG